MNYEPRIELGQLLQAAITSLTAVVLAAGLWFGLVDQVDDNAKTNERQDKALLQERTERKEADKELQLTIKEAIDDMQEEGEKREKRLVDSINLLRDDIKYLTELQIQNGRRSTTGTGD